MPFPVAPEGEKYDPTKVKKTAPEHAGLPVKGYQPQPQWRVDVVNRNKIIEEQILRRLDGLKDTEGVDQRWLAIGRTHFDEGWMAVNRAIFRPGRVALEHEEPQSRTGVPGDD